MRKWIALIVALLIAMPVMAQDEGGVEIIGGDDAEGMKALLARALMPGYAGLQQGGTVYVGSLPDDFALPVPDDVTVIGGVVYSATQMPTQIYLQTPLSTQEVRDFYTASFTAPDWRSPSIPSGGSGFVTAQVDSLSFCNDTDNSFVSIFSQPNGDQTDVTLYYQPDLPSSSQCSPQVAGQYTGQSLIPSLVAPAGAMQSSSSGGGSSDQWYTGTQLTTSLTADELAAHYGDQLQTAGWTQIDQTSADPVATSIWSLSDEEGNPWTGILIIIQGSEQTNAMLQVARAG